MINYVININGAEIDFGVASYLMDDELREALYNARWYDSDQQFFTAYERAHAEKYGEEWFLSDANPCY